MYQKLNIRTIGLIENMSHFACPSCGHESDIFGAGAGEALAADMGMPFLGRIPIYQPIREGGDAGRPIVTTEPESPAGRALFAVAEQAAAQISIASYNRPTIPLTVVR
jgi:ATP-binding protein involved in chromosome partitioning